MATSNLPGTLTIKLNSDKTEANVSFNEVAKFAAGDGVVILKEGTIGTLMSAAPASHVLTFGAVTLTYSDDDARAITYDD